MKKLFLLLLCSALILLWGCTASSDNSSKAQESSSPSQESSSQIQESSSFENSSQASSQNQSSSSSQEIDTARLNSVLDRFLYLNLGSAGSSLNCGAAACDILNLSYEYKDVSAEALSENIQNWYDNLEAEPKENLKENKEAVEQMAYSIIESPKDYEGLIADCGGSLNPSQPDKAAFERMFGIINDIF